MPKYTGLKGRHVSIDQHRSRQPPHCTICEGRPLRSECEHTGVGRAFLEKQQKEKGKQRHCRRCPGRPLLSECCHTPRGRDFLDAQRDQETPQLDHFGTDELLVKALRLSVESDLGASSTPQTPPQNEEDIFAIPSKQFGAVSGTSIFSSSKTPSTTRVHSPPANHICGDPSTPDQSSASTLLGSTLPSGGSSVDTPCRKSQRIMNMNSKSKASMSNPKYGMISGAMRGNTRYVNYRTRQLPEFRRNTKIAARRFLRLMHRLLQKCEDLAAETGCWIFLGAQHVTARGGAFHYVSPRFLREAQPTAEQLANLFNTTVSQLLRARHIEALILQQDLEAMREDKQAAERSLGEANAKIAEYERRFGALE